tara:strand:+ start:68 stop:535 length:468 start_codon:yes stop_codon:yes gene_type:complete
MKNKLSIFFGILYVIILGGCASTPVVEIAPFDKSASFEGDFNQSWSKLVAFMSTNDISIGTIEKDSGLITLSGDNLQPSVIKNYCDATSGFLSVLSSGRAQGSVLMVDDEGFITVTVNAKFQGTFVNAMTNPPTYNTYPCNSTGVFETAVLGAVQ